MLFISLELTFVSILRSGCLVIGCGCVAVDLFVICVMIAGA